jgi:hypothetical protein
MHAAFVSYDRRQTDPYTRLPIPGEATHEQLAAAAAAGIEQVSQTYKN